MAAQDYRTDTTLPVPGLYAMTCPRFSPVVSYSGVPYTSATRLIQV
jgi:hypothetical protein